jgi:hypothetical protein
VEQRKVTKFLGIGLICLTVFPLSVSATYHSGGRSSATFSAYYDSSVASYGYTSHYDDGRNNWNALFVPGVAITKTVNNFSTADEYYVGTSSSVGQLGHAAYYKRILGVVVPASTSDTWEYSVLSLYHNNVSTATTGSGGTSKPGLTRAEIVSSVTTHEIGHSLALAHSPTGVSSVMTANDITNFPPTSYDKSEIEAKW